MQLDRAQIGKEIERLADAKQPALRAIRSGGDVPLGAADGAEQHRIGFEGGFDSGVGQAGAELVDGAAAHQLMVVNEGVAEFASDYIQDFLGFVGHFRADAVAGEHDNLGLHWCSFLIAFIG